MYYSNLFALAGEASSGAATGTNDVHKNQSRTITPINGFITIAYRDWNGVNPATADTMIEIGTAKTTFAQYTATTAPAGTARKSLVGINNIWSDSGNITVTYWTH